MINISIELHNTAISKGFKVSEAERWAKLYDRWYPVIRIQNDDTTVDVGNEHQAMEFLESCSV